MTDREIEVDGLRWTVTSLPGRVRRVEDDPWDLARVRFEPLESRSLPTREAWLRLERDVPARDVLDQYEDAELAEALLVAEEMEEEPPAH